MCRLHHYITLSLYHYITISLHYNMTISLQHKITTFLLHHNTTTMLHYNITISQHHHITISLHQYITTTQHLNTRFTDDITHGRRRRGFNITKTFCARGVKAPGIDERTRSSGVKVRRCFLIGARVCRPHHNNTIWG